MGSALSHFFQSGSALLSSSNHRSVSEQTKRHVRVVFDALTANPRVTVQRLEGLLSQIPKNENVLGIHNEEGYNLLQKCVGINNVEMVRWLLSRHVDLNRGACSLPLHIACLKGFEEAVEVLLKHGARIDVEARMCWPGPHNKTCEGRCKHSCPQDPSEPPQHHVRLGDRPKDRRQNAVYYAIDGDQVEVLELLTQQQGEDHWLPWQHKCPLLHVACERGAWACVKYLVAERAEEINQCYDEYYPIHQATLHEPKFLELLIQAGAATNVRTPTQQLTLLHMLFLRGRKSADDTLHTLRLLLEHGLRDLLNEPDSLGSTPLHALIVRYALEEGRYGYGYGNEIEQQPWTKWDLLHLVRYLLQQGARPSINQSGNSALACVLRHVRDWEFRYELLSMLLQEGGDPNIVGRDGSVPLMVCLVPLINKDPLHHFTHSVKVFYLNCIRLLCKHGANPNCVSRSQLTPLHVLVFTACENMPLNRLEEKALNFSFIQQILVVLLQYGLDPNALFSQRTPHALLAILDMVQCARQPSDLDFVYDLSLTLIAHGADPDHQTQDPNSATNDSGSNNGTTFNKCSLPSVASLTTTSTMKRSAGHLLCTYVQMLTRREEFLSDPQQKFENLLVLYHQVMVHRPLYLALQLLAAQTSLSPAHAPLNNVLRQLHGKPRRLKQLARLTIHQTLCGKTANLAPKLPLPPSLKEYLMSFDP